jgi:hypothetical protein
VALSIDRTHHASPISESETPFGIAVGLGVAGMVVAGLVAAMIPIAYPDWRFGVIAAAVGLFAAVSLDQWALAIVAVVAGLIYNGFLEDRYGQLAWHGSGDLWRLLLLIVIAACGLVAGEASQFVLDARIRSMNDAGGTATPGPSADEEERGV